MNLIWQKIIVSFKGFYKDKTSVNIQFTYEVKRNLTYLFINDEFLIKTIKDCIQDWFSLFVNKSWILKNGKIDEHNIGALNSRINDRFNKKWCPKGIKIRNIEITKLS